MTSRLTHEEAFRGEDLAKRLSATKIVVLGVGALGSQIVNSLTRIGASNIRVVDRDRVSESNLACQVAVLTASRYIFIIQAES